MGFSLGVFLGILPVTGALASLFCAFIFRLNRISALLGSLLTNTWLSIVFFLLSIKIGSAIMHLDWHDVQRKWVVLLKDFHWKSLFSLSIWDILLPVVIGYLIIAIVLGTLSYFIILLVLNMRKKKKNENKNRADISK
jgi:uncharacterized protein (DUF2062 family)